MKKLSKQKITSIYELIDSIAGISFLIGLTLGSLYILGLNIPEELILSLIFGGLFINILFIFKLKSKSTLVDTLRSIWLLF
jgi:hypothetical protein